MAQERDAVGKVVGSVFARFFANRATVQVFRVEGSANTRILIGEAGSVAVKSKGGTLYLNFASKSRAEEFLAQKLSQGYESAQIKSFRVSKSFFNEVSRTAVAEGDAAAFPTRPFLVDVTKAPHQYGIRPNQFDSLRKAIVQGTGKVH